MPEQSLTIGYSPCPNDTYIMAALAEERIESPLRFQTVLADVETLNQWALQGRLDVTKLSFFALGTVLDDYGLLYTGAALGKGCGPLLVARRGSAHKDLMTAGIAAPGGLTTARLLLNLHLGTEPDYRQMVYSEVMPSVAGGHTDFGLIIHESRFTYSDYGLEAVLDLGAWWEAVSGMSIPLGGIAIKRTLGQQKARKVDRALHQSLQAARFAGDHLPDYILRHAQEMDPAVIRQHIDLYVNNFTDNIDTQGLAAVEVLFERARVAGLLPKNAQPITAY